MKTVVIYDFMIRNLKLSGVKLLLYACIHSFSQFGNGFYVRDRVICDFLQISRSQYYLAKKSLIASGHVLCFDNKLYAAHAVSPFDLSDEQDELKEAIRIAKINWLED